MYECEHQWQCPLFKRVLHKWCAEDCEMILTLEYIGEYKEKFFTGRGVECPVFQRFGKHHHEMSTSCDGCG